MKTVSLIAALLAAVALTACGKKEEAVAPAAVESAVAAPTENEPAGQEEAAEPTEASPEAESAESATPADAAPTQDKQ